MCARERVASYYDFPVSDKVNYGIAWFYFAPAFGLAEQIQ